MKKYLKIASIFFLIYFVTAMFYTYYLQSFKFFNVLFDIDTPRVVGDITLLDYNHYRIAVHPLMVIILQPIFRIINFVIHDMPLSLVLLQTIFSTVTVVSMYKILNKINKDNVRINNLLCLIFGLSFGQIVYTSVVETYIFAQTFLVLLWLFVAYKIDKKFTFKDYVFIILLGVGSISITITNFVQFAIALLFVMLMNKEENHRFFKSAFIMFCTVSISVFLANVQNIIWTSAPNFFTKSINDLIHHTSEEQLYVNYTINKNNLINVLNSTFAHNFYLFNLFKPGTGIYVTFEYSCIVNNLSIIIAVAFFMINIIFIYRERKKLLSHKLYFGMLTALIFNLGFHLIYGNTTAFLYICHYNFLIILIIGYMLKTIKIKHNNVANVVIGIIKFAYIILVIRGILILSKLLLPVYNSPEYIRIFPFIIIVMLIIFITLLHTKKFRNIFIIAIISILAMFCVWNLINNKTYCTHDCDIISKYEKNYDKYLFQLKEMINTYNVRAFEDTSDKLNIYFFGMADRRKMMYKDGELSDLKTGEIIKKVNVKKELIVPNEYMVAIIDKEENEYRVYENEVGIYFEKNGVSELISEGRKKINLPKFDKYSYSEILKVLHQEILFNIDGDIPKPNLFGYESAWYRDTMLGTMVLEKTNNTNLLENWVNGISNIYDNQRSKDIDEVDNLGELLYIIGAVNPKRTDLINKISKEIDRIKTKDKHISGMVDGIIQTYYPTAVAIYGYQKLNIKSNLYLPDNDDAYAKLTWYMDPIYSNIYQNSKYYPYINWAFFHYSPYGSLYILDEIYPLTYEGGDVENPEPLISECKVSEFYCNKHVLLSHMWHASEMFLFLIEL